MTSAEVFSSMVELPLERANKAIEEVTDWCDGVRLPRLTANGFYTAGKLAYNGDLDLSTQEVATCIVWLEKFCRPRTPCRTSRGSRSSYGLKHEVEKFGESVGYCSYVSNAALICAACYLKFPLRPSGLNSPNADVWLSRNPDYEAFFRLSVAFIESGRVELAEEYEDDYFSIVSEWRDFCQEFRASQYKGITRLRSRVDAFLKQFVDKFTLDSGSGRVTGIRTKTDLSSARIAAEWIAEQPQKRATKRELQRYGPPKMRQDPEKWLSLLVKVGWGSVTEGKRRDSRTYHLTPKYYTDNPAIPSIKRQTAQPIQVESGGTMVKLYNYAPDRKTVNVSIISDCQNEAEFLGQLATSLSSIIEKNASNSAAILQSTMGRAVDVCCKLRGYKNNVKERRLILAGDVWPTDRETPLAQAGESVETEDGGAS